MNDCFLQELDAIYKRYGFEIKKNHNGIRGYVYNKSVYPGIDLIRLESNINLDIVKEEYSQQGYAVKTPDFETLDDADLYLFQNFFRADGIKQSLSRKYNNFISQQMKNLPEDAVYEFIQSTFDYSYYNSEGIIEETETYIADDPANSIIDKIISLVDGHSGALFIIIEAAAGYGKTCTAYEILNRFLEVSNNRIPFFTELSMNRQATIFKYILLNEIEEQFVNLINSVVAIHEIKSGRIPLIIDGFDELISKDFSYKQAGFQEVENMLSTIVDLLQENAKVIITSRKTAIFSGDEFNNWIDNKAMNFSLARFTINAPSIENWLSKERIDIINSSNLPLKQIANPVLLAYLKHIQLEELRSINVENNSLVDKYFNFLLTREQERQHLLIDNETQIQIFKRITRLMTEMSFNSETREFFKDMFLSYTKRILEQTRNKYSSSNKPTIEMLGERLTNHAFLDRKGNKSIGIVNDFVFGTLIGLNLISGKYHEHQENFAIKFEQYFASLVVEAFKVQPIDNQQKLWRIFNESEFPFDPEFYFNIDIQFKKSINRSYKQIVLDGFVLDGIDFIIDYQFDEVTFSNCIFRRCNFKSNSFIGSCFVNCQFFDCSLELNQDDPIEFYIKELGCTFNNGMFEIMHSSIPSKEAEHINYEQIILELFFKKSTSKPKMVSVSKLKTELDKYDFKEVSRNLQHLKVVKMIKINGDQSYITKEGIKYYTSNFNNHMSGI